MKKDYEPLGKHLRIVDTRNADMVTDRLLGINIDKYFMPSVANVIGTDLSRYKLISKGMFACNTMHVGRDERLPVALYTEDIPAIVSPAYMMFEILDESILLPEYLMMWFQRDEFDRICWLKTDGSVRGGISWDDIERMELPVPPLDKQKSVVKAYQTITDRIALKRQINDNLEAVAGAIFGETFVSSYTVLPDSWEMATLDSLCDVKGGKRLPADCELLDNPTAHPYIRVRDITGGRYVCLTNQFQYIDEETHKAIARYIAVKDDIIISVVGTIGLIGKIHRSLDGANLTENCVRLTNIHRVSSDYLYYTLQYKKQINEIELLTVGAVQAKLPIYNIQSIQVVLPPQSILEGFQAKIDKLNAQIEENTLEIEQLHALGNVLLANLAR